ncbi:MAG: response regulator [Deltaproteobacteria bacterium]|nr:response regulator [Deltaproteobacteria bacterium]MBW2218772.1 response regulator [Deltaproteobacteria bacterium]
MTSIIPNVKIVVVDDDSSLRDLIATALMYCVNRNVLSFENGLEAWNYISSSDGIDIVVSDVNMPEMDGIELLSRIKDSYPDKICILMSGDVSNEKSAKKMGADAFLAKPFKISDLFDIVQTYIVGAPHN